MQVVVPMPEQCMPCNRIYCYHLCEALVHSLLFIPKIFKPLNPFSNSFYTIISQVPLLCSSSSSCSFRYGDGECSRTSSGSRSYLSSGCRWFSSCSAALVQNICFSPTSSYPLCCASQWGSVSRHKRGCSGTSRGSRSCLGSGCRWFSSCIAALVQNICFSPASSSPLCCASQSGSVSRHKRGCSGTSRGSWSCLGSGCRWFSSCSAALVQNICFSPTSSYPLCCASQWGSVSRHKRGCSGTSRGSRSCLGSGCRWFSSCSAALVQNICFSPTSSYPLCCASQSGSVSRHKRGCNGTSRGSRSCLGSGCRWFSSCSAALVQNICFSPTSSYPLCCASQSGSVSRHKRGCSGTSRGSRSCLGSGCRWFSSCSAALVQNICFSPTSSYPLCCASQSGSVNRQKRGCSGTSSASAKASSCRLRNLLFILLNHCFWNFCNYMCTSFLGLS